MTKQELIQLTAIEANVAATLAAALLGPGQNATTAVEFYRNALTVLRTTGGVGKDSRGKDVGGK